MRFNGYHLALIATYTHDEGSCLAQLDPHGTGNTIVIMLRVEALFEVIFFLLNLFLLQYNSSIIAMHLVSTYCTLYMLLQPNNSP